MLALQRTAGNRAVSRMLARCDKGCGCGGCAASCAPGCGCAKCTGARLQRRPKAPKVGIMDAKLVPPTAGPFEGAISTDSYERQPADLRRVLDASGNAGDGELYWLRLDRDERRAITSLYNRFQRFGLWQWTRRIRKLTKASPRWCGFWVQGDTASVEFEGDAGKLLDQLLTHPKFCLDAGIGGSLHPGQSSFREISEDDSLHVSVGEADQGGGFKTSVGAFDAHIDRYASPASKKGFACEYHPGRTAAHEGREVVPGLAQKKIRIGGIQLIPTDDPYGTVRPEMFERREDRERDMLQPPLLVWRGHWRGPWGM